MASHSDPTDWTSYEQACAASGAGVGFVFHEADPYSGVDLDGCRDPETGAIEAWAQRIIDRLNSYTEISPSSTGVKIFVRGVLPETVTHALGPHKGIEIYSKQRYFTVTGQHLAGTPLEIRDAQAELEALARELRPAEAEAPRRPAHAATGRATPGERAAEVIARLNCENDLGDLLEGYGATLVRTAGASRYYSGLRGDQHSHTVTYIVSPAKDGNGQIGYSYSPNGALNNLAFRRGFRWFDAYCDQEHGGNVTAALKVLNPIAPSVPQLDYVLAPEVLAQRAADAKRKRDARRQAANETLADVRARAEHDTELTPADRAVLKTLLMIADGRGWCRPSKKRIAELSEYSEGSVKRSLMRLEARGYFVSEGDGGGPQQTAIRTFLRGSSPSTSASEMIHEYNRTCDLVITSRVGEAGAAPQLDTAPAPEPDRELLSYVRALAKEMGDLAALMRDYTQLTQVELLDAAAQLEAALAAADQAEPPIAPGTGAWYDPAADWTNGGTLDLSTWRDPSEVRAAPATRPNDVPDEEPLVRCPPVEAKAAAEYWALKHKRPVTFAQKRWIARRLAELEIVVPASQALASTPPGTRNGAQPELAAPIQAAPPSPVPTTSQAQLPLFVM